MSFYGDVDLSVEIGDVGFDVCLWNAAGPRCTTKEELDILNKCKYNGAIVTKTCTLEERKGNAFPRVCCVSSDISINSVGLANKGVGVYLKWISETKSRTKPIFLSIGGLTLEENKDLLRIIRTSCAPPDFIELNVSCPNLIGHRIVGYDIDAMRQYLNLLSVNISVLKNKGVKIGCGVKLPPYFEDFYFEQVASLINEFDEIDYIVTINGVPNCLVIDTLTEQPSIKPKEGFGGVGGTMTKPIGLANVSKFRKYLDPRIKIIGCGGISTGEDVFQYILCGAHAVEVATQFLLEGEECFKRLIGELKDILKEKGYASIRDFRGKC